MQLCNGFGRLEETSLFFGKYQNGMSTLYLAWKITIYLTTDNKDNVLRANGIVYQVLANHFKTKS
jgi:hypothetical protein